MKVLRRSGWLSTTPEDFGRAVLSRCDEITLQAGEPVYRAGDSTGGIYGVVTGRVELHLPHLREDRSLTHIGGPGYWFGDLAAVSGKPRRFDVRARDDSRLARLSRAEILRLTGEMPEGWRYLATMMMSNLKLALNYVEAVKAKDSVTRVRAVLRNLATHCGNDDGIVGVSQDDLAALAGLSRKTVNSAMKRLEGTGEVTVSYRSVRINPGVWAPA